MAEKFTRFLIIDALEGGADTFVEASIATGIVPADGIGLLIKSVEVQFVPSNWSGLAADAYVYWSLSRDTKAAVGYYNDNEIMLSDGFSFALNASGSTLIQHRWDYKPISGFPIVEPTIYFQLDSNATAVALHAYCRLEYEEIKLSEVEILRILNG